MPLLTRKLARQRHVDLMPAGSLPMARVQHARPLRIALVTEYYYPHLGGICEHVHFFAREARRFGHQVDIITSNIPGARPEAHVVRIGKSQPVYANGSQARFTWGFELRKTLRRVFSLGQYDIVHVHSPLSPVLPVLRYSDVNDAIARANSTEYGLGSSVWSANPDRAFEVAQHAIRRLAAQGRSGRDDRRRPRRVCERAGGRCPPIRGLSAAI